MDNASAICSGCCVGALGAAVAIQLISSVIRPAGTGNDVAEVNLVEIIPRNLPGWSTRDLPLGQTEQLAQSAAVLLNFDSFVFREFRRHGSVMTLYLAHWRQGTTPTQLAALHTPDRCWTEAGWHCLQMRHKFLVKYGLLPAEWRLFADPKGARVHVAYWFLSGGQLYDYGNRFNQVPSVWRWWRDAAGQYFRPSPEHLFFRITSDRPFEELAGDLGWEELVGALAKQGLVAKEDRKDGKRLELQGAVETTDCRLSLCSVHR